MCIDYKVARKQVYTIYVYVCTNLRMRVVFCIAIIAWRTLVISCKWSIIDLSNITGTKLIFHNASYLVTFNKSYITEWKWDLYTICVNRKGRHWTKSLPTYESYSLRLPLTAPLLRRYQEGVFKYVNFQLYANSTNSTIDTCIPPGTQNHASREAKQLYQ